MGLIALITSTGNANSTLSLEMQVAMFLFIKHDQGSLLQSPYMPLTTTEHQYNDYTYCIYRRTMHTCVSIQTGLQCDIISSHSGGNQVICNVPPLNDLQGTQKGKKGSILFVQGLPLLQHVFGSRQVSLGRHGNPLQLGAAEPEHLAEDRPGGAERLTHHLDVIISDVIWVAGERVEGGGI